MNEAVPIFFASPDVRLRPAWVPDEYPWHHRHWSSITRAALSTGEREKKLLIIYHEMETGLANLR